MHHNSLHEHPAALKETEGINHGFISHIQYTIYRLILATGGAPKPVRTGVCCPVHIVYDDLSNMEQCGYYFARRSAGAGRREEGCALSRSQVIMTVCTVSIATLVLGRPTNLFAERSPRLVIILRS